MVRIAVNAKPRAKNSALLKREALEIWVALAAPPVDGAANAELMRFLSECLGVPRSRLTLLRGEGSRKKLVGVEGLDEPEIGARLDQHLRA